MCSGFPLQFCPLPIECWCGKHHVYSWVVQVFSPFSSAFPDTGSRIPWCFMQSEKRKRLWKGVSGGEVSLKRFTDMQLVLVSFGQRTNKLFIHCAGRVRRLRWHHKCSIMQPKYSLFFARRKVWNHVKTLPWSIVIKYLSIAVIFIECIDPCHVNNFSLFWASSFNSYTLIVFQNSQASSIGTDI